LNVRKWNSINGYMDDEMLVCSMLDEEASGLVVMARHEKARLVFDEELTNGDVTFEFVAITEKMVEVGFYRHFFLVEELEQSRKGGIVPPRLYEDIPPSAIGDKQDYDAWRVVEMEVVTNAELNGGYAALRIRTTATGWFQRIRTQLAMMGAPVLNDKAALWNQDISEELKKAAGLLPKEAAKPATHYTGRELVPIEAGQDGMSASVKAVANTAPLGGAVDDETLRGPYGHMLELLPNFQRQAERGLPPPPAKKVPVALHCARIEFLGRVIKCAPPAYWPEGAAAAVATKLTADDVKTLCLKLMILEGGWAQIRKVGSKYAVKVEWLEEHFPVNRAAGLVYANEETKAEWDSGMRVKAGAKIQESLYGRRRMTSNQQERTDEIRERFLEPEDWGKKRIPTYRDIKRGYAKSVDGSHRVHVGAPGYRRTHINTGRG